MPLLSKFLRCNTSFHCFSAFDPTCTQQCQRKEEKKVQLLTLSGHPHLCFNREYHVLLELQSEHTPHSWAIERHSSWEWPNANYMFDLKDTTDLIIYSKLKSNILGILGLLDHHWLIKNDAKFITPTQLSFL